MRMYTSQGWLSDMQGVAAENAATFGEPLLLIPADRRPNFQAKPDPSRGVTVQGVFSWRAKMIFKQNSGNAMMTQEPLIESREPIASFPRAALPWAIGLGDQVQRLSSGDLF